LIIYLKIYKNEENKAKIKKFRYIRLSNRLEL